MLEIRDRRVSKLFEFLLSQSMSVLGFDEKFADTNACHFCYSIIILFLIAKINCFIPKIYYPRV